VIRDNFAQERVGIRFCVFILSYVTVKCNMKKLFFVAMAFLDIAIIVVEVALLLTTKKEDTV